jgi:Zn-dependent protease with chaperone function
VSNGANQGTAGSIETTRNDSSSGTITDYQLPPDLYRKARNRGRINFVSQLLVWVYSFFILWVLLRAKVAVRFRDWAERVSRYRVLQAFVFVPLLAFTIGVFQLPLAVFDEWVLKLYRISVQPWASWLEDWATNQVIVILAATILGSIVYSAIRKSPRRWWLYSWALSVPLIFFFVFVSPYLIDPLFNRYEPLSTMAPQLIPGLQQISRRAGEEVAPERMFWMLASDKTIATNASVDGIGSSTRIVIWDTSIAQESSDEILADFGHEMGHYVLQHMWKQLWFLSVLTLVVLYLCYLWIGPLLARYGEMWGIRAIDDWASLPALLLVASFLRVPATAIDNTFTRVQENHADIYGLEVTHGIVPDAGQVLAHEYQKFGETVLMDPDPNALQVLLFYQHPPVPDRIRLFATYKPWLSEAGPRFVK